MRSQIDKIGHWPTEGEEVRRKKQLVHITPEQHLHLIHGKKQHIQVSLIVSNDYMHVGLLTIPPGGYSELEKHDGDEALYAIKGDLVVRVLAKDVTEEEDRKQASRLCYRVFEGEKCLIPEGEKHQYLNFSDEVVRVFFAVAPRL